MIIAVDFDGTIVENSYPRIGREIPLAFQSLIKIQKIYKHQLILWSFREGELLQEAIDFCMERGLIFYAINQNDSSEKSVSGPRKLIADLFIDNHNLGGIPDWNLIYEMIENQTSLCNYEKVYRNALDGRQINSQGIINTHQHLV
jgi:hypothetical protein